MICAENANTKVHNRPRNIKDSADGQSFYGVFGVKCVRPVSAKRSAQRPTGQ